MINSNNDEPKDPPRKFRLGIECAGCGYSLRGMATDAVCPECGLSVQDSLAGRSPQHAGRTALIRFAVTFGLAVVAVIGDSVADLAEKNMKFQLARFAGAFGAAVVALLVFWNLRLLVRTGRSRLVVDLLCVAGSVAITVVTLIVVITTRR